MTTLGTFGAGFFSIVYSYIKNKGKPDPFDVINGILCSLVTLNCEFINFEALKYLHLCFSFRWLSFL